MNSGKRKRLWCGLLAAACLVAGLNAGAADGTSSTAATLSYLNKTLLPALEKGIGERVKTGTQGVYDAALARVDQVGRQYAGGGSTTGQSGWTVSEVPTTTALSGGDVLTLDEGGSLLWLGGVASTEYGLVDATRGAVAPAGWTLESGHRYLNGLEGVPIQITVRSDAAQAAPAGRWTRNPGGQNATPFRDLCRTDWFYEGARWAYEQGIFRGVSSTQFDPDGTVTRATLATVLYRMEGSPSVGSAGTFTDVPAGQWYTAGVEWAAANRIVSGNGDGTFAPEDTATREQIAVMLWRYARYMGRDVSANGSLERFRDSDSVSSWARSAMSWAVGIGLITGSGGSLLPQQGATRAQVAVMLQRFQTWAGRA